ncbi:MAG: IclR family transcriptional regulator [Anaerolineales bacterium]
MTTNTTPIQTVHNIARLLRCFTETEGELGVMQLSRMLDLHKSTVSRLLSSLHQEGFIDKNPFTGKYQLGLNLIHLASFVLDRLDLREVARPYLEKLAGLTQETINIAVLDRDMCLNIESIISPKPIQHAGRLGARYPLYCTSTGRVLLSALPLEKRELILNDSLNAYTDQTITDRHALEKILEEVKLQGYAIVHEEYQEGLSAVAAPIRDHTGEVVAAISISGPRYRFDSIEIEDIVSILSETANEISIQLGGSIPR